MVIVRYPMYAHCFPDPSFALDDRLDFVIKGIAETIPFRFKIEARLQIEPESV